MFTGEKKMKNSLNSIRAGLCLVIFWTMICTLGVANQVSLKWQLHQSKTPLNIETIYTINEWESVTVPKLLSVNPIHGIYGVYRYQFDFLSNKHDLNDKLSLYVESIRLADVTYLNGQEIGREGDLSENWNFYQDNPNNLPRNYAIPKGLLKPDGNDLIIFINFGFAQSKQSLFPGGTGIGGQVLVMPETSALFYFYKTMK